MLIDWLKRFLKKIAKFFAGLLNQKKPESRQSDPEEDVTIKPEKPTSSIPEKGKGTSGVDEKIDRALDAATIKSDKPMDFEQSAEEAEETAGGDGATFRSIVLMVSKAFDYNPRKVKQFVNIFRLRIATGTALNWFKDDDKNPKVTHEQLGKCVGIRLQWPLFMRAVERNIELFKKVVEFAEKKLGTKIDENESEIIKQWCAEKKLVQLMRAGCYDERGRRNSDEEWERFSLNKVDMKRLLEVSGAVSERLEVEASTDEHEGLINL